MIKTQRELARWITKLQNWEGEALDFIAERFEKRTYAKIIGVSGTPGAGKSTLVGHWIRHMRSQKKKVAVLSVDPSSPLTGGAVLGDRIRLSEHFSDDDVFIRSLATRGKLGGLSYATLPILHLLEVYGFDCIFIETVGVGQSEVEVSHVADVTCLLLVPEAGDDIQALKSGTLEMMDFVLLNKIDRGGYENLLSELKHRWHFAQKDEGQVLAISAAQNQGLTAAFNEVEKWFAKHSGVVQKKRQAMDARVVQDWFEGVVLPQMYLNLSQRTKKTKNPYHWIKEEGAKTFGRNP